VLDRMSATAAGIIVKKGFEWEQFWLGFGWFDIIKPVTIT
jgi:hypothetical protein